MALPPTKCTNCGGSHITLYGGADFFHPEKDNPDRGIKTAAAACQDCGFLMFFVK